MTRIPPVLAVFPPANGPWNFARDDAMLARARATGREWIRVYAWDGAVVSFGRHERALGRFSPQLIDAAGIAAVRRQTGGRALLHHHELTYAVAGPATDGESLRASYARIGELLSVALATLGVTVEIAGRRTPALPADNAVCFASPAPGELTVGGRKLVASAQWREHDAYLQHGSILIDNDQARLATLLEGSARLPPLAAPATLRELLPRVPNTDEFADALATAVGHQWHAETERVAPDAFVSDDEVQRRLSRFVDSRWTWRR